MCVPVLSTSRVIPQSSKLDSLSELTNEDNSGTKCHLLRLQVSTPRHRTGSTASNRHGSAQNLKPECLGREVCRHDTVPQLPGERRRPTRRLPYPRPVYTFTSETPSRTYRWTDVSKLEFQDLLCGVESLQVCRPSGVPAGSPRSETLDNANRRSTVVFPVSLVVTLVTLPEVETPFTRSVTRSPPNTPFSTGTRLLVEAGSAVAVASVVPLRPP